jgi:glutathione S-transferase
LAIQGFFDDEVAPALRRLFWACYLGHGGACARMACDGFSGFTRVVWRSLLPVMRPLFRRNMGMRADQLELAHEKLGSYFDRLESEIGPSGYLVGDRFGVADLAVSAVMTAIIRPPQFPYPLPEPWPAELVALRDSVAQRRGFAWVLDMYARHRGESSELRA